MNASRLLLAAFFILAGTSHFIAPSIYLSIVPTYVPWPETLVVISGGAEIIGGVGVLPARTRVWAGWGLIALLLVVFPANIQAISTGMIIAGHVVPTWLLWARLPFQFSLIAWVYRGLRATSEECENEPVVRRPCGNAPRFRATSADTRE